MSPPVYRIRFHGRGGQGMKTASRILGSALFAAGLEVQDAPRYGAERRGAPMFAYVRASRAPINERGVIVCPDLVVVADDTLIPVPAAGVLAGVDAHTLMLLDSDLGIEEWRSRLNFPGQLLVLPRGDAALAARFVGAACAGAAARLTGLVSRIHLENAVRAELASLGETLVAENLDRALAAWEAMADHEACVQPGPPQTVAGAAPTDWIELPFEDAARAAPDIRGSATSVQVRTGLWRTLRPVIDDSRCNRCWWVCSTFCPDSAISVEAGGRPRIDYDHCKGCMVCVAQCPAHAIEAITETSARAAGEEKPA